jgi:magnesium transporter
VEVGLIRLLHIQADGKVLLDETYQIDQNLPKQQDGLFWLDIFDETDETVRSILSETFQFNSLSIDDALDQVHVPKIDDWEDYLYLTLHAPVINGLKDGFLLVNEIDVFLGEYYLLTYHNEQNKTLDTVWHNAYHNQRINKKGPAGLLYALADALISEFMLIIDNLDEQIEQIEDELLNDARQILLEKIFTLKRSLLIMRRVIAPSREVMNKLSRGDFPLISPQDRILFRDLYDHLVRLHDIIENLRELIGEALDTYLSVMNNRLNDIMRILTIITTFFMPLTFLTGFFGMNFFQPVEDFSNWTNRLAFILLLVGIFIFPWLMFRWMRNKKWL